MLKNLNLKNSPPIYQDVPLIGEVAAGAPVEWLPFIEFHHVPLPHWASENDQFVVVRTRGDSLINARISDGDLALVYVTQNIRPGDLVAVRTPEGMMMKFIFAHDTRSVRLESANPNWQPRVFDVEDVEIQGLVVSTERQWR